MINKKRKIVLVILIVILIFLITSLIFLLLNTPKETVEVHKETPSNELQLEKIELEGDFDIDILKQTFLSHQELRNTVISPLSLKIAMSMAAEGASGNTLAEIQEVLGIDVNTKKEIKGFIESTESEQDVTIKIANSLWGKQNLKFNSEFIRILENYYNGSVEEVVFSQLSTNKSINDWVSENTNNKIETIVPKDKVLDDYIALIMNAIYFNGKWTVQFDEENTDKKEFTLLDESTIEIDLMSLNSEFDYYEDEEIQLISLPYGDSERYAMRVYLPSEDTDYVEFLSNISKEKFSEWNNSLSQREGVIKLPKFNIEYRNEAFVEIFRMLGVQEAFSRTADFSKMTTQTEAVISRIVHKTYIDVTEEGTEAAAVTVIFMGEITAMPTEEDIPFTMIVDRPFLFTIEDTENNIILFVGAIVDPRN